MQQFGTGAIGYLFSPIILTWLAFICGGSPRSHPLPSAVVSALVPTDSALWAGNGSRIRGLLLRRVNAGIGIYNIVRWDWTVLRAISPHYWIMFLVREGQDGWRLLGSLVLCITGVHRRSKASTRRIRRCSAT